MADKQDERPGENEGPPSAMDPETFAAHYLQAYPSLHLIASSIVGDRTHAHDIVQEAFIVALEKAGQFVVETSYVAWLSEIVRRLSLNYARKMRGRRTAATDPDLIAQTKEDDASGQDLWPISMETGEVNESQRDFDDEMVHALSELTTEARCCLLLRVIQNLSYSEISELMKIPEGTAMSHVHRGKRKIRQALEQRSSNPRITDSDQ